MTGKLLVLLRTVTDLPPLGIDRLDICRVHDCRQGRIERTELAGDVVCEGSVSEHVLGTAVVRNAGN